MDIHKPKAWHSAREFLKEYTIIVVGVLTALAFEQGVETLRWAEKVERGQAHAASELTVLYYMAVERSSVEACLNRRLTMLSDALLSGEGRWTPLTPAMGNAATIGDVAYIAPTRPWSEESWKTLIADGTANHLSDKMMLRYARLYTQVAQVRGHNEAETAASQRLGLLRAETVLSRAERNQLVVQVEELRLLNRRMALSGRQLMGQIARIVTIDPVKARAFYEANSNAHRSCTAMGFESPPLVEAPAAGGAGGPAGPRRAGG